MDSKRTFAALGPILMLLACQPTETARDETGSAPAAPGPTPETNASAVAIAAPENAPTTGADDRDDGSPDLAPPQLTPEAERGVEGARNVLLSFARAVEQEEYGQAWALLSPADKRKWSRTQFAAIFADLRGTVVAIPSGTMEGAAGSSYYTAPVTVTGSDRDGRPIRIEGQGVLRRVNDVDGAIPAQRRWHFETLTLDWTH